MCSKNILVDYLGLDHIGHVEGPLSNLVPPKLREMDDVIKMIHEKLQEWVNNQSLNFLFKFFSCEFLSRTKTATKNLF